MSYIRRLILGVIGFYQKYISTYLLPGAHCRFQPTCSQYAFEAFSKYNPFKAFFLTVVRISKCHPFHKGGYDPLP